VDEVAVKYDAVTAAAMLALPFTVSVAVGEVEPMPMRPLVSIYREEVAERLVPVAS
jgi:hypothetical protein